MWTCTRLQHQPTNELDIVDMSSNPLGETCVFVEKTDCIVLAQCMQAVRGWRGEQVTFLEGSTRHFLKATTVVIAQMVEAACT